MFVKSTELDKHTFKHILFNNYFRPYKHNKRKQNISIARENNVKNHITITHLIKFKALGQNRI